MNPLSASSSSLNSERARLEAARTAAGAADPQGADAGGFAQLLQGAQQGRGTGEPPAPTGPVAGPAVPPAPGAPRASSAEEASRAASKEDEPKDDDDADRTDRTRDTGPTLAHWLLNGGASSADPAAVAAAGGLPPAQQPGAPSDDLKAAAMARQVLDAVRQRARSGATQGAHAGRGAEGAQAATQRDSAQGAVADRRDARPAARETSSVVGPAQDAPADAPKTASHEDRFADALQQALPPMGGAAAAPSAEVPGTTSTAAAGAAAHGRIDPPVHDAGFGAAVGVTISRLAKEGAHEAHLQLNPAELGPVSVRIEMHGQEARLSLGAAQAETRALLDASLPALAEAFRADGLVLAASQVGELGQDPSAFAGQTGQGGAQPGGGGFQGGRGDGRPPAREITVPVGASTSLQIGLPGIGSASPRSGPAGALDLYA